MADRRRKFALKEKLNKSKRKNFPKIISKNTEIQSRIFEIEIFFP